MVLQIAGRVVGEGAECFLIAEAGVNHNGDVDLARRLIDVALSAGCDAVKFQTFRAQDLVTTAAPRADYQVRNTGEKGSQRTLLEGLELSASEFELLKEHCDRQGIIFLSTPHTEEAVDLLEPLVPCFKIASGDLTNLPLLRKVGGWGKPVILGTGMADLQEVRRALAILAEAGDPPVIVLHCTTAYPCPPEDVHLRAMLTMKTELGCPVGYSDHTLGIQVPVMAATLGAVCIEKHFTLDRGLPGPDHSASLDPEELSSMATAVRRVPRIMGNPDKVPTPNEVEIAGTVRKSLVARVRIPAGVTLSAEMLAVMRPGTGIEPAAIDRVLGRRTAGPIHEGEPLHWNDLEG